MKKQYPFAIKDWKKPEQYPDSNAMSKQELAWEFIRRNPDYQSNYDDLKDSEWQISPDETAKDWADKELYRGMEGLTVKEHLRNVYSIDAFTDLPWRACRSYWFVTWQTAVALRLGGSGQLWRALFRRIE